jgi:hypothetical protein
MDKKEGVAGLAGNRLIPTKIADLAHESLTDSNSYASNRTFATNGRLTAAELSAYAQTIV